jgi:hypothetical protein
MHLPYWLVLVLGNVLVKLFSKYEHENAIVLAPMGVVAIYTIQRMGLL